MNQKLSDWASIAEILGAVAIVISLIFVGLQISEGNRETRAATTQAALDAEMVFQTELIRYADVWRNVVVGGDLSDEIATQRAITLFNLLMTQYDNRYQMSKSGYHELSDEALRTAVVFPFYDIWRGSGGAAGRSQDFLEYVDEMRRQEIAQ